MADYTVKRIPEMDSAFLGAFKRARAELGVSAWGMQVVELPPNIDGYPEHDHAHDGQEEVFVTMSGRGELEVDGETIQLEPDVMVRVGPEAKRKVLTRDSAIRLLLLGGTPGQVYEPTEITEIGAPDPMAQPQA